MFAPSAAPPTSLRRSSNQWFAGPVIAYVTQSKNQKVLDTVVVVFMERIWFQSIEWRLDACGVLNLTKSTDDFFKQVSGGPGSKAMLDSYPLAFLRSCARVFGIIFTSSSSVQAPSLYTPFTSVGQE